PAAKSATSSRPCRTWPSSTNSDRPHPNTASGPMEWQTVVGVAAVKSELPLSGRDAYDGPIANDQRDERGAMELYTAGTGNGQRAAIAVNECGVRCTMHVLNFRWSPLSSIVVMLAIRCQGEHPSIKDWLKDGC